MKPPICPFSFPYPLPCGYYFKCFQSIQFSVLLQALTTPWWGKTGLCSLPDYYMASLPPHLHSLRSGSFRVVSAYFRGRPPYSPAIAQGLVVSLKRIMRVFYIVSELRHRMGCLVLRWPGKERTGTGRWERFESIRLLSAASKTEGSALCQGTFYDSPLKVLKNLPSSDKAEPTL